MKVTIIKSNISTVLEQIKNEDIIHFTAMKCEIENIQNLPFQNLKLLDLSYNKIEECSNIPASIQYLNLSHNNISTADSLHLPLELKCLNLSHNPITKILHYRSKMIKILKQMCPNIIYLDNIPIKTKYYEKVFNADQFEDIMGYSYHLILDE